MLKFGDKYLSAIPRAIDWHYPSNLFIIIWCLIILIWQQSSPLLAVTVFLYWAIFRELAPDFAWPAITVSITVGLYHLFFQPEFALSGLSLLLLLVLLRRITYSTGVDFTKLDILILAALAFLYAIQPDQGMLSFPSLYTYVILPLFLIASVLFHISRSIGINLLTDYTGEKIYGGNIVDANLFALLFWQFNLWLRFPDLNLLLILTLIQFALSLQFFTKGRQNRLSN